MYWVCTALVFGILLVSCNSEKGSPAATQEQKIKVFTKEDYAKGTEAMAHRISKAFESIDPSKATFLVDHARIEMFRKQMQSPDLQTSIVARSYYAYELLNAGKTEQAITELEGLLKEYKKYNVEPSTKLQFHRLLAIAYLRLGEQANCINTRNHASCILPISKEGQYQMTTGSEAAMKKCEEILQEFPDDAETMYLLNLAAMTIGKYPSGVPAKWRLPESSITSGADFPRFLDVSHEVGIRGTSLSGGVCIEDFDGDGWLDIIRSSWGKSDPLKFWRNQGDGTFTDASGEMGLRGIYGGLNMIHGDINNDGLPDIFILRGAWLRDQGKIPNSMILNLGSGAFADITMSAGLLTFAPTQTAVFADFDLDGWLDLFVGNESGASMRYPSELYLNNHDNTFRNVIAEIGTSVEGFVKGSVAGDINQDGWPDLYLSLNGGANLLLLNKGLNAAGIPQFQNIASTAGVQAPFMSFPTWIWDYDNDGDEDIFVSTYGESGLVAAKDFVLNAKGQQLKGHPVVYRNNGDLTFTDVSAEMGLTQNVYAMGSNYGDLDNDGFIDFYLGTGTPEYSAVVPNKMYHNVGGKRFDDVTASGGFGHIQKGHAIAFGDLDRDGDEDIFECLGGAFSGDIYEDVLFQNPMGQKNNWIVLQLRGVKANRLAIGASVRITVSSPAGERNLYRRISTGGSFGSSSLQLEVGLGDATAIREVAIVWPVKEQTKQVFQDVKINSYCRITEGQAQVEYLDVNAVMF